MYQDGRMQGSGKEEYLPSWMVVLQPLLNLFTRQRQVDTTGIFRRTQTKVMLRVLASMSGSEAVECNLLI